MRTAILVQPSWIQAPAASLAFTIPKQSLLHELVWHLDVNQSEQMLSWTLLVDLDSETHSMYLHVNHSTYSSVYHHPRQSMTYE